jgi:hypothetical protein
MEIDGGKGDEKNRERGGRGRGGGRNIRGREKERGEKNRGKGVGKLLKCGGRIKDTWKGRRRGRKREGDAEIGSEGRKRVGGGGEAWQAFRGQFDQQQQEQPGSPLSQLRHILLSPPPTVRQRCCQLAEISAA